MKVFEFGAHGPKPPIHIRMQIFSPSAMQSVLTSTGGFKCTLHNTQQLDSTRVEQQCRRIASKQARAPQRSISWGASGVVGSSTSPTTRTQAIARCIHCCVQRAVRDLSMHEWGLSGTRMIQTARVNTQVSSDVHVYAWI